MKERKISRRAVCSAMVASLALGVLEGCGMKKGKNRHGGNPPICRRGFTRC